MILLHRIILIFKFLLFDLLIAVSFISDLIFSNSSTHNICYYSRTFFVDSIIFFLVRTVAIEDTEECVEGRFHNFKYFFCYIFGFIGVILFSAFMSYHVTIKDTVEKLLRKNNAKSSFLARQLIFSVLPPSHFVENYLYDNEGRLQKLDAFPMLKHIYDNMPQKLLLKCSRKTLKSTLLSNFICLNLIRWNYFKMMYVGPQELTTKYFSSNYIPPRFESPKIKNLLRKL